MNESNTLKMYRSINQGMMIARMTGVVVTLLCRLITSEPWHHCAALTLFLSFFLSPVLPSIWYSAAASTPRDNALFPAWVEVYAREGMEKEWESGEAHEWKKIWGWNKGQSMKGKREKMKKISDEDEGIRQAERRGRGREETERGKRCKARQRERQRENGAPWPPIFIHQRSTSGNYLSVSECMDGRLAACKGSHYTGVFLSLVLTRWQASSSVLREAWCTLSYRPTPSFMPSFSLSPPSKLVCFKTVLSTGDQMRAHKKTCTNIPLDLIDLSVKKCWSQFTSRHKNA